MVNLFHALGLIALLGSPLAIMISVFVIKVNDYVMCAGGRSSTKVSNYKCKTHEGFVLLMSIIAGVSWLILAVLQTNESVKGIGLMFGICLLIFGIFSLPSLVGKVILLFQKRGSK